MTFERSFGSGGIQRTIRVRCTSGAVSSWIACPGPMMQNLDLVDVILLAGAIVYFGLVVLRRI
jgi:hypothetical protein